MAGPDGVAGTTEAGMVIERRSLREQVREELVARMRAGAVAPGESINEVALAADLGVSRTPLREALIALEAEGQIESTNGRGFRFAPLDLRDLEELAPVLAALEGLALELSPADELRRLGVELLETAGELDAPSDSAPATTARDEAWHDRMLSACPNRRLLAVVASLRATFQRYESLVLPEGTVLARFGHEHHEVARALAAGDVDGARAALTRNWSEGTALVVRERRTAAHSE